MKLAEVPTTLLVGSGKGGVGKTTVSSDIARTLRDMGYVTGLIDADISTPNSPEVVGGEQHDIEGQRLSTSDAIVPPEVNGIQIISQGHVLPDDVPILGGGGFRAQAVADYIENVEWDDETDVVVIDTPPGTGEELQTIASAAPPTHAFVVSTPHPSSIRDATKTHEFFKEAGIKHTGILNMAYIPGDDIATHAADSVDFTAVQNVGDARAEEVADLMQEEADDLALFGYDPDGGSPLPIQQDAAVPYTEQFADRTEHYEAALYDVLAADEVNA